MNTPNTVGFITHYHGLYGANRSLIELMLGLREHHGVLPKVVVARKGPFTDVLTSLEIDFFETPVPWWARPQAQKHSDQRMNLKYLWRPAFGRFREKRRAIGIISNYFQAEKVELVHSNSSAISLGRRIAKRIAVPHVWHLREFLDLDYDLYLPGGWQAAHREIGQGPSICISDAIWKHFGSPTQSQVISNPIGSEASLTKIYSERKSFDPTNIVLGIVGFVTPSKGQSDAVRILAGLREHGIQAALRVVGDGPNLLEVKSLANELGIGDSVIFTGYVEQPLEQFKTIDIALTCSRMEAWGRTTAEAMSAGCLVCGRNTGGTPEIIQDNNHGVLWDSTPELVEKLVQLLRHRPRIEEVRVNAHRKATKHFSTESHARSVIRFYSSIMK